MTSSPFTRRLIACASAAALMVGSLPTASAQSAASQDLSMLSALPIAVSVAAPVMLLSAGANLVVVSVEASATGSVWVLERASDGARATLRLSAGAAGAASAFAGEALVVTAIGTGYLLSAAGAALAFIPNAIGASLLYNERVTL